MNNYYKMILEKGIEYNDIYQNYFILNFRILELNFEFENFIEECIKKKKDFELDILEMERIVKLLDLKVSNLLKHPDFNPFKEKLRNRFPEQYGSHPFIHGDTTYYLYAKGRDFYIDSLITNTLSFKELLLEHIKIKKKLKYVYKKI
ncbi:hypothetical protein B4N84_08985 [Flavobacterium sp. IR1]|nr:hypothetical protein B4N84_08985 [Flavobacterium sp. IR1]